MKRAEKAQALLCLAGGKSIRATAREVGVDRSTVAAWTRNPVFAAEVTALREQVAEHRHDRRGLLTVVWQAMDRVAATPPKVVRPRRVPPNPSPEQKARITARYHARGKRGPWDPP